MKRLIALLSVLLLAPVAALAQVSYVTITGTVVDPSLNALANATLSATLVNQAGFTVSSATTPNGQLFNGSPVHGSLDASGHFSISLMPNALLSRPASTQWMITISAPQDTTILAYPPAWNVSYRFTVTGAADISTQLSNQVTQTVAWVNLRTGQGTIGGGCPLVGCTFSGAVTAPAFHGNADTATHAQNLPSDFSSQSAAAPSTGSFKGVTGSVNGVFNVMAAPFNAKNDCSADATAAFDAAQSASIAAIIGNGQPPSIFVPSGCYIVSDWIYKGVPLSGPDTSVGTSSFGQNAVTLQSLAGQQVFKIPDPSTTTGLIKVFPGWSIRNIGFAVDGSPATTLSGSLTSGATSATFVLTAAVNRWATSGNITIDSENISYSGLTLNTGAGTATATVARGQFGSTAASHASAASVLIYYYNRFPGRFFDDGAMTASSTTFTTTIGEITCGDQGQAIRVTGAGAGGTDLITTIASVGPCWASNATSSFLQVTLAAAASTTVTNAHVYIAAYGLPVTATIGNCAISFDMYNGLQSAWTGTYSVGEYPKLENVTFNRVNGFANNPCAIFTQGGPDLYGATVTNFGVYGLVHGIVQTSTVLNSFQEPSAGDYEKFDHGIFFFTQYPWLSVNGLSQRITDVQTTASNGWQVLTDRNSVFDFPSGWHLSNMGFESPLSPNVGWHVTGSGHIFDGVSLSSGAAGQTAYFDANSSTCNCGTTQTQFNGFGNVMPGAANPVSFANNGMGNQSAWTYNSSPAGGYPTNYPVTQVPYKGRFQMNARFTPDFITDGNISTPYNYDDLIIWPQDFEVTGAWGSSIVVDANSPSGYHFVMAPGGGVYTSFNQFVYRPGSAPITIGTDIPATGGTLVFSAWCPSTTTISLKVTSQTGGSQGFGGGSCTTTPQTFSATIHFVSTDVGKVLGIGSNIGTFNVNWIMFVPAKANYNGYQPAAIDGNFTANALNWAWGGQSTSADASSPVGFSTALASNSTLTSANGSTNLVAGQAFQAVPSKVSFWIGAPSVVTTSLGASLTNSATTLTLAAATTSAWPSAGNLLVDSEVLGFSGVTAGLTSITITRAQYGTVAFAHSNGAAVFSLGVGQMAVQCNSVNQTIMDVYFAPTMRLFSAPFPAQNCAGFSVQIGKLIANFGFTGQTWNVAQVQVKQDELNLSVPTAAAQVPMSAHLGSGFGNELYAYNALKTVGGAGANLVTQAAGATILHDCPWYADTAGTIGDSGSACGSGPLTTITLNTASNTDSGGVLTLTAVTTASFTFTHGATSGAYTNTPVCTWTPRFNVGTATYWDTSSTSQAQITFSSAVTGSMNYVCVVRNN